MEILGKHRPYALEHEVPQNVEFGRAALSELPVEVCDEGDRLARELGSAALEHRISAGEEVQDVEVVRAGRSRSSASRGSV